MSIMTRATGAATLAVIACTLSTTASAQPLGVSSRVLPLEAIELVEIPRLDFQAIDEEDHARAAAGEAYRFAIPHRSFITPANGGTWERLDANSLMWRIRIASRDATSINLAFEQFELPQHAQLVLYTADGLTDIRPFTSNDNNPDNQLWTPPLPGDDIVIELQIDDMDREFVEQRLALTSINIGYRGFYDFTAPSRSGSCNYDVECPEADEWRNEIPCVAAISTGGSLFCTGFMVNNLANDGTPFFMTANHCGISSGNAASLVAFWNFQDAPDAALDCPGNSSETGSLDQFTSGSTFRAGGSSSDFTLVEFYNEPEEAYGVGFCGWDANDVITEYSVAIHQPNVDAKRWSIDYDASEIYGYNTPGTTHLRIVDWDLGTTEPGSSGSPLFNPDHRIVGQLHGGYAACGNDLEDWYGRFAVSYPAGLSDWLDPSGSGSLICDTLGTGLSVDPSGDILHVGAIGGPFNDADIDYTLSNNTDQSVAYNVSQSGSFTLDIDGNPFPATGTLAGGNSVIVNVALADSAYALPAGVYVNTVSIVDVTNDQTREIIRTLEIGQADFTTDPDHGMVAGGPIGGPFPSTQDYVLTSTRPTSAVISITSDVPWISINGGNDDQIELTYDGDSETVTIGFSADANSLPAGIVTGTVTFDNINGPGGDTTREVTLDVGRFTYAAYDTPLPIEDNQTTTSTIDVGDAYCIGDVDVELDITHTYIGDLIVDVTSPEGTTVRLHDRNGGSDADIMATYDDDGDGTPPDGPGALSDFDGEIVSGTWTMTVSDNAGADTGTLNAWTLKIASSGEVCPPVAYGQSVYCDEDSEVQIELEGISPEGNDLSYAITSLPIHGQLQTSNGNPIQQVPFTLSDNIVTFVSDSSYIGPDDFTFMVTDGELDSPDALVSIQVGVIPNPDECDGAAFIANGQWEFDTTAAGTDGNAHSECEFDGQTYHDVWYRYEACSDGPLIVSTCEDLGGSADFDTDLVVYEGIDCNNLTLLGCNDDDNENSCGGSPNYHSTVTVNVTEGDFYTIRVGGWNEGSLGTGVLLVHGPEGDCGTLPCPADHNGDGNVGVDDLLLIIGGWGDPYGVDDLLEIIGAWGVCP
jgi:lysyl endopeptidase